MLEITDNIQRNTGAVNHPLLHTSNESLNVAFVWEGRGMHVNFDDEKDYTA
jgi:hypothetical protein